MPILVRIALFSALFLPATAAPKPLQKFENCTFVPTEWADGDSFRIKTAGGEEHTIRLYGVDCIELHVARNERNLARLREQRRYFGIADAGKNNQESMKIALALAKDQNAPGPEFKIDPNTATREQLIALNGIGDALADRIIEERKKTPFRKAEDLLRVKRLPKPTLEKIRPHLVFSKQ